MGPPRVLINCMSSWQGGSSRNYYSNILRELDRDPRGFEFTVLAPAGELSAEILGRNRLFEVQLPDRFRTSMRVVYELAVLPFRARGFDLVYCTADLLPIWSPAPVVVAFRNFNIYDRRFYDNARTRIFFHLVRWKVGRAAAIVTPSRSAAAGISMALGVPEERFSVVPHGVFPEAFGDCVMPPPHDRPYLTTRPIWNAIRTSRRSSSPWASCPNRAPGSGLRVRTGSSPATVIRSGGWFASSVWRIA